MAIVLSLALAQGPPDVPGPPPVPSPAFPAYADACCTKGTLVTFVGTPPREIAGVCVCHERSLKGFSASCIVVSEGGYWLRTLPASATDAEILGKGVSQQASPFEQALQPSVSKPAPSTADDSPWLSRAESKRVEAIWPKALTFPTNLRFYKLEPRYQNMSTMNNGRTKVRTIDPLHDEFHPFLVSGGMHDMTGWGSVKGLDIPTGKRIAVWEEDTDVRAFSLVPRWRWQFPQGTVAYDVLYTRNGIFEIRTQERTARGWSTKVLHKDAEAAPSGYTGLQQSCASCHDHAAEVVSVPGRIYMRARWGDDGRFSWRPFDESGNLDARWPIERR